MSSPFETAKQKANNSAHANADTDADRSAIHHTLGPGPNQASPGNHKHKAVDITDQIIRAGFYVGDFSSAGFMNVAFASIGGSFPSDCISVVVNQGGEYANPYGPINFQIYSYDKNGFVLSCDPVVGVLTDVPLHIIAIGN